jgi:hypothetical protein
MGLSAELTLHDLRTTPAPTAVLILSLRFSAAPAW